MLFKKIGFQKKANVVLFALTMSVLLVAFVWSMFRKYYTFEMNNYLEVGICILCTIGVAPFVYKWLNTDSKI